ncbi:glycosyltransferase involved in cell wall biosynthesis [Dysgonomonas sp. PH5-45]|uniref:glycosyltransferase n=1 Tax=unclassified Dysgonomonas TaxID=2630389 RepID=UPI002473B320|nr:MULTISPECIES: glycosyltransferase [unclassified Dysgonomonas]MDH6355294.1 glycosyltransferase involved in cell wall biosynthesis [Dysgonomonas sp. PH5-45]MDH6388180.1 glycosyltransferase involved in cell wall biosynthesis [Dysgonomonas sp. PH5-37]
MGKNILLSICCLAYNHESFIRQCLDGFIMQKTNFNFEVLINDDASTDGTADIIREYEIKYPDIIKPVYQKENQYSKGVQVFTNLLSRAKYKYIALCEGDDYWTDPNKLQRQVDLLEQRPDIVLSAENGMVVNPLNKNSSHLFNIVMEEMNVSTFDLLEKRKFPTASVVFRSECIKDCFRLKENGDTILWVLLSTKGVVHYNPVVSSVYNRGGHGVVESTPKLQWAKKMESWNRQIIYIIKHSKMGESFNYKIFKERNFSEYSAAYKKMSFKIAPVKKMYCLYKCFVNNPWIIFKLFPL